ncbi:MAG: hypothetical protein IJL74_04230 [Bacilli bacterium]|nr:hypothetical protein [Bacilli bacterium]
MENNSKRTLILSIIGILVLVIAVVGVSFAMFTFSGTGTKENVLKTGTVTVAFDDNTENNTIEITNQYPEDDTTGMSDSNNETTFTVEGDFGGNTTMSVNYEVGLSDITTTPASGATIGDNYVKVAIQKNSSYVKGSASGGVLISSFASDSGPLNLIDSYYITNGTLTDGDLTDTFTVKAYLANTYDLPDDPANSTAPEVTGGQVNNNSGTLHKKTSKSETYSFKVKVVAAQA